MFQANYRQKKPPAAAVEAQRGAAVIEHDPSRETLKEFLFRVTTSNEGGCGTATFLT